MRFGLATREIVPPFPTGMHGYGVRLDLFDGVNDPVTFTAVVLEEGGRRAFLGAADLCTFANDGTTPALMDQVAQAVGCPSENVLLCASHTHGGPQMPSSSAYFEKRRFKDASRQYREWLDGQVVSAAQEAVANMTEGTLWFGEGRTSLPMNRRPDRDGEVPNAPNPEGPVDDRMQLLALRDAEGALKAVGMRLSCHPVTTGAQHLITACSTRPDFLYEEEYVAVYIDGYHHLNPERQNRDREKMECLEDCGFTVIRFTVLEDWRNIIRQFGSIFGS